jgi:c-di-GMP-binding flagellar brake protein YcgR
MREHTGPEKRRYVRVEIVTSMHMVVFDAQGEGELEARELVKLRSAIMCDLSINGFRLETNDLKDEWISSMLSGKIQLALKFHLPNSPEPINATAKAMWIEKNQNPDQYKYIMGLKFIDIDEPSRVQIMEYIIRKFKEKKES